MKIKGNKFALHRGQAVVEFALVFPLFILLCVGIFEFGMYFWAAHVVQNASREGARYATVLPNLEENDSRVIDQVELLLPPEGLFTVSSTTSTAPDCETDRQVTVTITGTYNFVFLNIIGINGIDMNVPTSMHYESC